MKPKAVPFLLFLSAFFFLNEVLSYPTPPPPKGESLPTISTVETMGGGSLLGVRRARGTSSTLSDSIQVNIEPPEEICYGGTVELQGFILTNVIVSTLWTTLNGNIISGEETLNAIVNQPGTYYFTATQTNGLCVATDSVEVFQLDYPFINIKATENISCETPEVTIDASNSSNNSAMIAQWTTPNGNIITPTDEFTIEVDLAGTYIFTLTDSEGACSRTDSVVIEGKVEIPFADAGEPMTLNCKNPTLTLTGTAEIGSDIFYEWDTDDGNIVSGEETLNPVIDEPGEYNFTVWSDITDCETTVFVSIKEDFNEPTADAGNDKQLTCAIPNIILNGTASSSGDEFTYEWNTIDGNIDLDKFTPTPTVDKGGEYFLTVTDTTNGCFASDSATVKVNFDAPEIEILPTGNFTCATSFMFLDGSNSTPGSHIQYLWMTVNGQILADENTPVAIVGSAGDYTLTLTNSINECVSTETITVNADTDPPEIQIETPESLTCVTHEITLDASGSGAGLSVIYQWQTSDGNILSGETTATPTVDSTGTYELTVLNILNGCSSESEVVVNQDIAPPIAEAGDSFSLNCNLPQNALNGDAQNAQNPIFEWTTSDGNFVSVSNIQNPIVDASGTYFLTITNAENGCTDTDEVSISESILTGFEFENTNPTCDQPFAEIQFGTVEGGEAPFVYSIDGGESFQPETTFENLPSGQYDLIVQDLNGCELADQVFISEITGVEVFLESEAIIELGDFYTAAPVLNLPQSQIAEIIWSPTVGLDCTDCLNPNIRPEQNTVYEIEVRDENGCVAKAEIHIQINRNIAVYVPNAFSPDGDGVNDRFTVFAKQNLISEIKTLSVFDRWGGLVFSQTNFLPNDVSMGWTGEKGGQKLDSGIYVWFAEIEFSDGTREVFEGDVFLR